MAVGHFKLNLGKEVALHEVPAKLGGGPFTILRVDTRDKKTTVHFSGESKEVKKAHPKAVAVKPADIAKL